MPIHLSCSPGQDSWRRINMAFGIKLKNPPTFFFPVDSIIKQVEIDRNSTKNKFVLQVC